jgi:hypothetical protein
MEIEYIAGGQQINLRGALDECRNSGNKQSECSGRNRYG